jgi:dTDP-4-amino-4,6-dideoxygalactose transaminase
MATEEPIPIADPDVGAGELERVRSVLEDGQLADGPEVRRFESAFADYCETDRAVATTNGTTALHAALHALGVGAGDAVVTTPLSFVATANAVRHVDAEPVFADVEPDALTLDPDAVERILAARDDVAAILVVHLYGLPARMDRFRELADAHDVALVEDAAQAHGAEFDGRPVGSLGDAACFSFYPTKNMTTGEGGMITTNDPDVARRAKRFIDHGRTESGHAVVGHNFRMTSLCAAIGLEQLEQLPAYTRARRRHAARLSDHLAATPVETPPDPADRTHVYHQYTVLTGDRDELASHLADAGVESAVYYPRPIHHERAYDGVSRTLPVAERAADEVLSLPVHPGLAADEVDRVAEAVRDSVASGTVSVGSVLEGSPEGS